MPILNQSSLDRIGRVVNLVETRFEDATRADDPGVFAQPWVWHQLTEPLDSDTLSAKAQPGLWLASAEAGAGRLYADRDEDHLHTVRDTTQFSGATKGDWVLCRPIGSQNGTVWEIVAAAPRDRHGKTDAALEKDGKVTVSLWSYDAEEEAWSDTDEDQEDVHDSFWYQGLTLPAGVMVTIRYTPENSRWEIVEVPSLDANTNAVLTSGNSVAVSVRNHGVIDKVYDSWRYSGLTLPTGAKITISFNSESKRWEIVKIPARLDGTLSTDANATPLNDYEIDLSQLSGTLTARTPRVWNAAAPAGTAVSIDWNEVDGHWEIMMKGCSES